MSAHVSASIRRGVLAVFWSVAVLAISVGPLPAHAAPLYFADIFNPTYGDGSIRRVNTDGTGLATVLTVGGGLRGLDVDPGGSKMYWTDVNNYVIRRANLDGSGIQDLVTSGLEFPFGIRVDPAGGKMYWGDQLANSLSRANLDGSNVELMRSTPFHWGVAVDHAGDKVYWSTSQSMFKGQILRSNLDGTNLETVVTSLDSEFKPANIALDVAAGKIYWTDYVVDVVRRANLDGTDIQDLYIAAPNHNPRAIALDLSAGKLYWGQDLEISGNTGAIMRMNLDGSSPETVISGLGLVQDIALIPEPATVGLLVIAGLAATRRRLR